MIAAAILAGLAVAVLATMAALGALRALTGTSADRAAQRMAPAAGTLGHRNAARTAKRLGVASPGLTIGHAVKGGRPLLQGWEDTSVDVAGPRTGKTTCRVVPAILEA